MRGWRRSAAGVAVPLAAALALQLACGSEAPVPEPLRLLAEAVPATLGDETRLATGPVGRVVLHGEIAAAGELPRAVRLPAELASASRLLLEYRSFTPRGDPQAGVDVARRSVAVEVEGRGPGARAPLPGLGAFLDRLPTTLHVTAHPLPDAGTVLRFDLRLPEAAVLELGYGIREEAWGADAESDFRATLVRDGEREVLLTATLSAARPAHQRWFDARVALPGRAGESAVLELASESRGPGASLPVWSDPVIYSARGSGSPERPSIVIVSIDTLRARSLATYGYVRDTAPFLTSLAEESAVFADAITTSVTTAPSHMSLLTGLYPVRHGMLVGLERASPNAATLAEILRDAGYRTAAFTEDGYLVRRRGFGRGFAQYTENRGPGQSAPGQVERTFAQARAWLEANRRRPYFLFVHTYEVHAPYDPDARLAQLFAGDGVPGPEDAVLRGKRDDYEREIRGVDEELARLFEVLRSEEPGSVLVWVLSDHGEEFGEHGLYQHGGAVYEETLHVPLLLWAPERVPPGRHAAPVSLVDVTPTVLELAGVPAPERLDGRSLVPVLRGEAELPARPLFAEARAERRWLDPFRHERWNPPLVAVRTAEEKFVVHRPLHGPARSIVRFDLVRDPAERDPLPVDPAEAKRVDALVDRYLGGAARDAAPATRDEPGLTPDERDRLRGLGYVD